MRSPVVAVIDIGSNSIKFLIARRLPGGRIEALGAHTLDARISAGISRERPRLGEEGMQGGLDAIRQLLRLATEAAADQVVMVATSAVRDAENGADFCERVRAGTGHPIRILGGEEEANLIGRGLTCDPALGGLENFHLFDLGGGSLECLAFRQRQIVQAVSLKLGCVRLTERFVADPEAPFSRESRLAVMDHVRTELGRARLQFAETEFAAVFAGGSMTTVRAILGARGGLPMEDTPALITVDTLRELLDRVAELPLVERKLVPGLPAARADVFPAALATMLALAETGRLTCFHHSLYNLRWGLADETLRRTVD